MPATLFEIEQRIQHGVAEGTIPRFLYKYKSLQPEYALEFLTKSELYFSTPKELNDPFDCQINIDTNNTVEEVDNWLRRGRSWLPRNYYKLPSEFFVANPEEMNRRANVQLTQFFNESGIHCFAGDQANLLMWSHYGDSHRGVCIKFDVLEDPEIFHIPLKVKYQRDYPIYNQIKDGDKFIEKVIQTKSLCWEYENEFRVYREYPGKVKYNPTALIEVCFGCNASIGSIEMVKSVARNRFAHLEFKKAEVSKTKYELIIKDI